MLGVRRKGFTLLEILVVIGIIAIIIGFGAASYSTAQKKARDSRRKSDIKDVQACFEQYYANNNFKYPVTVDDTQVEKTDDPFQCGQTTLSAQDPLNNITYKYSLKNTTVDGSTYTICADSLETESGSYCLDNQQ